MVFNTNHFPLQPQEVRSHLRILSDPSGSARTAWAEMYDGRFIPALKTALEDWAVQNGWCGCSRLGMERDGLDHQKN